jgi:hypothetical protein
VSGSLNFERSGLTPTTEGQDELLGPVEVGRILGVKPQVVVNWIREGRAHPSAVDGIGRNRFTAEDVVRLRAGLGQRRTRSTRASSVRDEPEEGGNAGQGG